MGNCLRIERGTKSSSVWSNDDSGDDEDWVSPINLATQRKHVPEKQGLLQDAGFSSSSSTSTLNSYSGEKHKEIKIKITRKQLQKLLGEVDVHELPADQVLSRLINISNAASDDPNHDQHQYQHSWRPHLQSIPEVD